jgi:flagellar basal body-associated protein FliL
VQTVVALVVATLIGAVGGGVLGFTLVGEAPTLKADQSESSGDSSAAKTVATPAPPRLRLRELPPIVTNLAAPETSWVRLQAAIVFEGEALAQSDVLLSEVTADIVAFLRTMTLSSIEGAEGLRRLHEDLSERAVIRSEGRIHELIIQALVVQ